MQIDSAFAHTT